jgi:hypothetical protein
MLKTIKIGGADRPVNFNFNCLEEFEAATGVDTLNGLKITAKNAKALIYYGLKYGLHEEGDIQPDFTIKKVGAWLTQETILAAMQAFNSQGEPEEKKSSEVTSQ